MRLIYVNGDRGIPVLGGKGAAVHVRDMLAAFAAIGCETRLLAARLGAGETLACPVEQVRLPELELKPVGVDRARALIKLSSAIENRLVAIHAEQAFDVIYERYSLWSTAGVRAATRLGLPCIVEVNAPLVREQEAYRKLALPQDARRIEAEVFAGASGLSVVSAALRDYVIGNGADPERIRVLGNAADVARFHPGVTPAALDLPPGAFVIGFAGGLKKWHGVENLLEAFRRVHAEAPGAHLLIVGDGPMRGWIDEFVAAHELGAAVTMTGGAAHNALPGLLARMDVATAPYPESEDFYFSPLKLYEYLAVGRPVVASAIGQLAEIVTHGECGLLVPPGDIGALSSALISLERNRERARSMSVAAAREGAAHSWTRNAKAALDLARTFEAVG